MWKRKNKYWAGHESKKATIARFYTHGRPDYLLFKRVDKTISGVGKKKWVCDRKLDGKDLQKAMRIWE